MAAPNVLPKTGQETSYRDGDDGYYEAGWEGDRFTDNGDGTITDNATNLMWPDDANGAGGNNGVTANWNDAIDYAEGLSFAGHDDWRLPNAHEFMTLVDYAVTLLTVNTIIQNAQGGSWWTSSTDVGLTDRAWACLSTFAFYNTNPKTNLFNFFCCRDA